MTDRLLIVDDEPSILSSLRRVLANEKYEIIAASSGQEALSLVTDEVRVVISDMRMPGMDGGTLLEKIASEFPSVVRMVVSVHVDKATILDAVNRGLIYRYIEKPWNDDDLRVTIRHAFEYYHLRAEKIELADRLAAMNRDLEKLVDEQTRVISAQNNILQYLLSVHSLDDSLLFIAREMVTCIELVEVSVYRRINSSDSTDSACDLVPAARWRSDAPDESELFIGDGVLFPIHDFAVSRILREGGPVLEEVNGTANPFRRCERYSMPLRRGDRLLGMLSVTFPPGVNTVDRDRDTIAGFSRFVAIALADAGIADSDDVFNQDLSSLLHAIGT